MRPTMPFYQLLLLYTLFIFAFCQDYDCGDLGVRGKCMNIYDCPSALKDVKFRLKPKICNFNGTSKVPNVCCLNPPIRVQPDYLDLNSRFGDDDDTCKPLSDEYEPKAKQIQQGNKAWEKCVEYQDTLVFPCTGRSRQDRCFQHSDIAEVYGIPTKEYHIGGGIDVAIKEYAHMALLGYGNDVKNAKWLCGGSLISEKFIVTAAHCISTEELGNVSFATLGVLKRSNANKSTNTYKIKSIIRHPDHRPPSKYNDIALLETENIVVFNEMVMPACLHVGDEVPDTRVIATGWGALGHNRGLADTMQNVPLWKVSNDTCASRYPPHRHYKQGYNATTQMCYGDDGQIRDTCMGDSGGPLQIVSQDIYCMYLIIGVTSFGHVNCAQLGYPGIYTRVAHYVPWIESVVWP